MDPEEEMYAIFFAMFFGIPMLILAHRYFTGLGIIINGINNKDTERYRARLSAWIFHETHLGLGLDLFQVALSLFSCGLYVYETYKSMQSVEWWQSLELTMGSLFAADYLLRFYLAKDRLQYFFDFMPLIDFVTVVPTFIFAIMIIDDESNVSFLRVLRRHHRRCSCTLPLQHSTTTAEKPWALPGCFERFV